MDNILVVWKQGKHFAVELYSGQPGKVCDVFLDGGKKGKSWRWHQDWTQGFCESEGTDNRAIDGGSEERGKEEFVSR